MKSVTTEFKSAGLHEKHVVATWNLEVWVASGMHILIGWILKQTLTDR